MQPFHPPGHRQTYVASPDLDHVEKESHTGSEHAARLAREAADGVVRDYEEKRDKYVSQNVSRTVD